MILESRDSKFPRVPLIAYLTVTSEHRVDEPVRIRAWMDSLTLTKSPPSAVVNAEVTRRYSSVICAQVVAIIDRPNGAEPVSLSLKDDGFGADKVANDGIYSAIFRAFNDNGRYGVTARVVADSGAKIRLGDNAIDANACKADKEKPPVL